MKVRKRANARSLFLGWSRVSVHSISISSIWFVSGFNQGYLNRTPDSTLLTFCPPAPLERNVSHLMALSVISTSNASASGSTATEAADVWTRPCVSVAGTRCTRWTPDSYLSVPYTFSPVTVHIIGHSHCLSVRPDLIADSVGIAIVTVEYVPTAALYSVLVVDKHHRVVDVEYRCRS